MKFNKEIAKAYPNSLTEIEQEIINLIYKEKRGMVIKEITSKLNNKKYSWERIQRNCLSLLNIGFLFLRKVNKKSIGIFSLNPEFRLFLDDWCRKDNPKDKVKINE